MEEVSVLHIKDISINDIGNHFGITKVFKNFETAVNAAIEHYKNYRDDVFGECDEETINSMREDLNEVSAFDGCDYYYEIDVTELIED